MRVPVLLGFKKNPFIFMKRCKLFLLTSIYEGHSNVLIHSQYLNNKILSSSAGGANNEVLSNNGTIFETKDPLKAAILAKKILDTKKKNIKKNKLIREYSDKKIVNKIENLIKLI